MSKPSFVILASGEGTNFQSICEAINKGELNAEVKKLITNKPTARALERAKNLNISNTCVNPRDFADMADWDKALCKEIQAINPELVILVGFLLKIGPEVLRAFKGKIINTHPSLLPKYGGKGMYGRKVHEAVIESGDTETGVSVHEVTEHFDDGPVLDQKRIPVSKEDTPETLESRVKRIENQFLVEYLKKTYNTH